MNPQLVSTPNRDAFGRNSHAALALLLLLAAATLACGDEAFDDAFGGGDGEDAGMELDTGAEGVDGATDGGFGAEDDTDAPRADAGADLDAVEAAAPECENLRPCCYFLDENSARGCLDSVEDGNAASCQSFLGQLQDMDMCKDGDELPKPFEALPDIATTRDPFGWDVPCVETPNPLRLFEFGVQGDRYPGPCSRSASWSNAPERNWDTEYRYDGDVPVYELWTPTLPDAGEGDPSESPARRAWTIERQFDAEQQWRREIYQSYPERWVYGPDSLNAEEGYYVFPLTDRGPDDERAEYGTARSFVCDGPDGFAVGMQEFDADGNPLAQWTFSYTGAGLPEVLTRADGLERTFEYDEVGRLVEVTSRDIDGVLFTDRFIYSNASRAANFVLTAERDVDRDTRADFSILYSYDEAFNLLAETWIEEQHGEVIATVEYDYGCWDSPE